MMKKVVIAEPGTSSNLKIVSDAPVPEPKPDEIRIKLIAAGVSQADIMFMRNAFPGQPKFPFTPGFDCIGRVDAVGEQVKKFKVGDLVAALDFHGSWSEYVCYSENHTKKSVVAKVREDEDPLVSSSIILSYMTAYEMLNRAVTLAPGSRVLIHGISGSVGLALAELAALREFEIYGTCSGSKIDQVRQLLSGVKLTLIDYKTEDFVSVIRKLPAPAGVDVVFDAIGGHHFTESYYCLRNKGYFVAYGMQSLESSRLSHLLPKIFPFIRLVMWKPFSHLSSVAFFAGESFRMQHPDWFDEDFAKVAELIKEKKLNPVIKRFGLNEIVEAATVVEKMTTVGKVVITFDETPTTS